MEVNVMWRCGEVQGACGTGGYLGEFFLRFVVKHTDSHSTTEKGVVGMLCRHVAALTRYCMVGKFHAAKHDSERGAATHAHVSAHKLSRSVVLMPLLAPAAGFF